ncbi:MAG: hypothetical protein AAFU50_11280, partial [Pseudomonadota bacterium]
WFPLKQFTKWTARAAALTAVYKLGDGVARNARIHILDKYNNRVSAFRAVHERIPDDKRTAVQRARSIDAGVKVYVDGHYKLTAQQSFSERDRRGRRPPNVAVVETSSRAGANEKRQSARAERERAREESSRTQATGPFFSGTSERRTFLTHNVVQTSYREH